MFSEGKRLRLVSDGTPIGTHVTDVDGNKIAGIMSVCYRIDAHEMGVLEIEIVVAPVEVDASPPHEVALTCSVCGHLALHTCPEEGP